MEILDIVNENDEIVHTATIKEVYSDFLSHRIVHVLIFNDKGEMALQLRSKNKHYCPNHWSTIVGGHVQSGETYDEAMKREMIEEMGINIPFEFMCKEHYKVPYNEEFKKHVTIYKAKYNGPFEIDLYEVDEAGFFSLDQIQNMINKGEKFHPKLLFLLKKHYEIK